MRLTSWVVSANSPDTEFSLINLPCDVFSSANTDRRCGVAIGDQVLDMTGLEEAGLLTLADHPAFDVPFWNKLMELGPAAWGGFSAAYMLKCMKAVGAQELRL